MKGLGVHGFSTPRESLSNKSWMSPGEVCTLHNLPPTLQSSSRKRVVAGLVKNLLVKDHEGARSYFLGQQLGCPIWMIQETDGLGLIVLDSLGGCLFIVQLRVGNVFYIVS